MSNECWKSSEQIEKHSVITQPVVEVHSLKNLNSAATAELLTKLYTDVLSARQAMSASLR